MNRLFTKITMCLLLALCAVQLAAGEKEAKPWDIIQIGIWRGVGTNQNIVDVYGIRAGLPVCGGKASVNGLEIGLLGAGTDEVNGFQWGVLGAVSEKIRGLALGLVTVSATVNGVRFPNWSLSSTVTRTPVCPGGGLSCAETPCAPRARAPCGCQCAGGAAGARRAPRRRRSRSCRTR